MRRSKRIKTTEDAEINITPMLDIVFIMLIFFIVTTSFVKESGIDIQRPSAKTSEKKKQASILIGINKAGEVWIDRRRVDIRAVSVNIEKLKAQSPEGSVVIQADKGSVTDVLVQVMDQVRLAGVKKISVATSEAL